MSKKITIEYFGMTGEGSTVKEAKLAAGAKIEKLVKADFSPIAVQHGGHTAFMWREVYGWNYAILKPGENWNSGFSCSSYGNDKGECEKAMRRGLAQYLINPGDRSSAEFSAQIIKDERDRKEHYNYCEWQFCYRAWRDLGKNDTECRDYAGKLQFPS